MSWFPKSTPQEVDGGLKARSRRGDIGDEWWSRRFVDALESYGRSNRLKRGKNYARRGQVVRLDVTKGSVEAPVQGSRSSPYQVSIGGDALSEETWSTVVDAMAERSSVLATLLAGEMPPEIEEVFEEAGASLFPARLADMRTSCTCPDSANPCKHIAAVFYILAEKFDDDPFLILTWRGRSREELLEQLRQHRGATGGEERAEPLGERLEDFWQTETETDTELPPLSAESLQSARPDAILHRLGEPPHELEALPPVLRIFYEVLTE